jgi:hypothetical protein
MPLKDAAAYFPKKNREAMKGRMVLGVAWT